MRIGFDVSQTGQFKTGCGYFADSLARQLVGGHPEHSYILYPSFGPGYWDPNWRTQTLAMPHQPHVSRGPGFSRLDQLERFWMDSASDLDALLGSPDIVQSNNFFCPTHLSRARLVYTLHDLAFAEHPEWTTEANWRTCFEGVFEASIHADHILCVSAFTRRQFLDTFPHYPEKQVSVVHEASRFAGPSRAPAPRSVEHLQPDQFWLTVGTDEPRKNHARLLEAYARLKATRQTPYPLVIAGGKGWLMDELGSLIESLHLTQDVERLGYVDDSTLQWLYENCTAFCYPSLYEGFGLPVVEAMSLGSAILTSNVTSLPEVVGEAGILVDPLDPEAIYTGMNVLASDADVVARFRLLARTRAAAFSWRTTAEHVLDVYRMLLTEYPRTIERKAVVGAVEP